MKKVSLILAGLLLLSAIVFSGCVSADIRSQDQALQDQITNLEATVAAQAEQLANLPDYATVTELHYSVVEDVQSTLKVSVRGEGSYPVMVTLYGSGLDKQLVKTTKMGYSITNEYMYTGVLVVVVEPVESWLASDTFELSLTQLSQAGGVVYFATASVGRKG